MKPIFEKVPRVHERSIFCKRTVKPKLYMPYHYHPEFELCFTYGRKGKRFIGNSVEEITHADLVFLGKNLPHCFWGDEYIAEDSELILMQFHFEVFGQQFLEQPETAQLRDLVNKAQRGMLIHESEQAPIIDNLIQMIEADPFHRMVILMDTLYKLTQVSDYTLLISKGFEKQYHNDDYHRLNNVYRFIIQNFKGEITLAEAARVANLSETAFCRYFKQRTTKTFKEVVNEMRISFACDMILNGKLQSMTVQQLANEAGFHNISNFNRQFKKIAGMSPAQYAKAFAISQGA